MEVSFAAAAAGAGAGAVTVRQGAEPTAESGTAEFGRAESEQAPEKAAEPAPDCNGIVTMRA